MAEKDPYDLENYSYQWTLPPPPPSVKKERIEPLKQAGTALAGLASYAPEAFKSTGAALGVLGADALNRPVESTIRGFTDTAIGLGDFANQINPQRLLPGDYLAQSRQGRDATKQAADAFARRAGSGIDQALPDVPVSVQQSLADYARDQITQAEMKKRQFEMDNPSPERFTNQLIRSGVQSLGEMGIAFGSGALTALATRNPAAAQAATLGTMGAFNLDRNISAQQRARGVDTEIDYGSALRAAAAQSAVDSVLGKFVGGDDVARALNGETFTSAIARGVMTGAKRGALEEGTAEVIQQAIERGQQGFDLFTPNAMNDYTSSFIMGSILGGGTGAVTGALAQAQDAKVRQEENRKAEQRREALQKALDEERAYQSFFPIQPPETPLGLPAPEAGPVPLGLPAPEAGPAPQIEGPRMVVSPDGNVGFEPIVGAQPGTFAVTPEGEAVFKGDTFTQRDADKAFGVTSPERETAREDLIRQANEQKIIQPDTRSPFTALPMIAVRGQPAYRARILGPSEREGYVRVLNEDTNVVTDVPRKRLVSKPEPKDPDVVAKLPPSVRRAEELRAKDLHQKQIDAMLYGTPTPASAPPAFAPERPPLPSDVAPAVQEGQPPMVQGELDFNPAPEVVPQEAEQGTLTPEPVAEMPQDTGTDPALFVDQGDLPFSPDTDFGAMPVDRMRQGDLPFDPSTDFGVPPSPPEVTGDLPFEQGLPTPLPPAQEVLPPDVEDLPPLTRNQPAPEPSARPSPKAKAPKPAARPAPREPSVGLTVREQQYNDAGPLTVLQMIAEDAPQYAPIAQKVAETMQRMMDSGHTFNFKILASPQEAESASERRVLRASGVGGLSSWYPALRKTNVYLPAASLGRHGSDLSQAEALMHEMLHAVTQPAVYYSVADSKLSKIKGVKADAFAKELETIRKELAGFVAKEKKRLASLSLERRAAARSRMPEGLLNLIDNRSAALQDANELLAYGMTQPKMLQFYDTVAGKGKSVFTKFVEAVRKFLNLPAGQDSALSRIIAATEGVFNRDMAIDEANTKALLSSRFGGKTGSIENFSTIERDIATTGQAMAGPAQTAAPNGIELAAAQPPMDSNGPAAVYAMQRVDAATRDPKFIASLERALREELRALGFNGRIPIELQFNPNASHWASARSNNGQTIAIALGLANDAKDIPGAVQAIRPFLTGGVIAFGEQHGLLSPDERAELLAYANNTKDLSTKTHFEAATAKVSNAGKAVIEREVLFYAKNTKDVSGKTIFDTVAGKMRDASQVDIESAVIDYTRKTKVPKTLFETVAEKMPGASQATLEREAVAYAVESMTRLSPEKWRQQKAEAKQKRVDPRSRPNRRSTPTEKTATGFKNKIIAVGKSLWSALKETYNPKYSNQDVAYDIAVRLSKGDIAYRARGDARFIQPVQFAGWVTPPEQAKVLGEQIRQYMNDMGLSDIGLRMTTAILKSDGKSWSAAGKDVLGSYFARTVTLSMAAYDPSASFEKNLETMKRLVDHEVVHALRATGAWTPSQWMNLVTYVTNARDPATNETYLEKAQRMYGAYTKDMSAPVARDVINEEAVSLAFQANFDVDNPVPTGPRNLLSRIAQVLFGIGRASYKAGILSPEMLTPNGNEIFAAIRSGQVAKQRRELGASSPADTAIKFALADTVAQNVNPAIDPSPEDVITQSHKRNRNPFQDYLTSTDLLSFLLETQERRVPLTQKIPGISKLFAPIARLEGHDAFLLLKGRTVGAITDMKQEIAIAIDEAQRLVGNDPRKRDQITAYMEGGWGADPNLIDDTRLRDLAIALKLRVSQHGRLAVEQGLLAKDAFDKLDGKYLHRMYTTDKGRIFNSIRLLMPDMGWTKSRSQISEIEKANRGEVTDPLVSIANYLAKSGEALLIDRMMDTMSKFAAAQAAAEGGKTIDRPWVMDAQDMILWRGKEWSPLAVEAEIESLRTDVKMASAEWASPDPKRAEKTAIVEDTLKNARLLLMRNPLWLKLRGLTPADVARQLGVEPDADVSAIDNKIVEDAYDVFLRIPPQVRNNRTGLAGQAQELGGSVVANFAGDDYVQVPNTAKWGRLRGMLVIREIYDVMNATGAVLQNAVEDRASVQAEQDVGPLKKFGSFIGSPEAAAWVMSFYKKAKTVFNPATHGVNWLGNMVTFETLGGAYIGQSGYYAYKAVKQIMAASGDAYEVFRDYGGGQTGQHASELTTLADPRFQAALKESMGGMESGDPTTAAKDLFNRLREAWAKIDGSVSGFYQLSDSVFKVAKIQMDMERGIPPEEAFLNAQDLYLDYTIVPPIIRAIRSLPMGSPFITWTYLMSGQILDKLGGYATLKVREDGSRLEVPYIFMMAPAFALYAIANAAAGADDFEDEDKKYLTVGLPSFTDGGQGLLFAGLDSQGRPLYFDIGKYWAGMTLVRLLGKMDDVQVSDTRPSGVGGVLQELGFMSDPFSQAVLIMMGRDPGTFKPVTKTGTLPAEGALAQAQALADLMSPPWAAGMADGSNSLFGDYGLATSLATRDNPSLPYEQGRPALTFGQKAAKLFGVTAYLTDPMPAMEKKVAEATRLRSNVQTEITRIMRDPALSEEDKAAKAEKLRARWERMVKREEEMKAQQAEMTAFYERYRQAVVAKGLEDPYAGDMEEIRQARQKTKAEEVKTFMEGVPN